MHKNKSHRKKKFRLLLDSAFANPRQFPKLSKKANITHTVLNHRLSPQAEDEEIYELAVKENRFVVTINFKDFKKLVKRNKPGIIGIESQLSNEQIDSFLVHFVSEKDPDECLGKAIKI